MSKTVQSVNVQLKPAYTYIFNSFHDKIKISNDCTNQKRTHNFISGFILSELFTAFFVLEEHTCTYSTFP